MHFLITRILFFLLAVARNTIATATTTSGTGTVSAASLGVLTGEVHMATSTGAVYSGTTSHTLPTSSTASEISSSLVTATKGWATFDGSRAEEVALLVEGNGTGWRSVGPILPPISLVREGSGESGGDGEGVMRLTFLHVGQVGRGGGGGDGRENGRSWDLDVNVERIEVEDL